MPMAMRNLAIAQQRDQNRYCNIRGGGWARPKATFAVGDSVMLQQPKGDTLDPTIRPHILRILELRSSSVAVLQGNDGATVAHLLTKLAHCFVPVSDTNIYPETYERTDQALSNMWLQEECKRHASL